MSQPAQHHGINYIEFTTTDIAQSRKFYEKVFGWNFQDYGPDYISFDTRVPASTAASARATPARRTVTLRP